MRDNDFSDLQTGDRALVQYGYNGSWATLKVVRLTKTQIITETAHGTENRFKFDGRLIGGPAGSTLHHIDSPRALKAMTKEHTISAAHRIISVVEKIRRDLDEADMSLLDESIESFRKRYSAYLAVKKVSDSSESS